jgi:group I intron endonuclease
MKILRDLIEVFRAGSKTKNIPRASGIYQIRCIPTGKIYVGSAVDIRARWQNHRSWLKRGKHRNKYLQAAWDKYGESNFDCDVLELVDRDNLLQKEQLWISQTECTNREIGFNLYDIAGSPGDAFAEKWEGFIDPAGNEVVITNLEEFCRKNGLERSTMWRLAKGTYKHKTHKGWTHKNSVRKRDYVKTWEGFIDPDGNPVAPIKNLAAFCREHNLDDTHMIALANGKLHSHKGWTHVNKRENLGYKTYNGFVNPQGQRVVVTNLHDFCRKNNLHPVHMHQLINRQRKSHKGWTWRLNYENE